MRIMDRQPETNYTMLEPEPVHNQIISTVIKEMDYGDRKVQFLNITHLTQFRYDGHPSRHREQGTPVDAPQDCSHWCLPHLEGFFHCPGCTESGLLVIRIVSLHFLWHPVHWFPFPSLSQVVSGDPTFLLHMWMVSKLAHISG